ncbi:MAG: GNAT family N-acetyltransferase [Clostridia bacterium]|nr:GNAT family N-acetyltransferase [Clostridia bacterium]
MAYFLFKCWHERLFHIERKDVIRKKSDLLLDFVPITYENTELVRTLRGDVYAEQFQYQLSLGDFGYYAYHNGQPVGYGWVKHKDSDDYFFKIAEGCCYLCRFFVHESMRGHGIYPALITALINKESECNSFYIAVERGNDSSERGLRKVGFEFLKEYGFLRGFKHTINKKTLNANVKE